jgi:hydrogenase maturation protease
MTADPLIAGLGSPHGDDQAGWRVIARLHDRGVHSEMARTMKNPSELWDWCDKNRTLIICDAIWDDGVTGSVKQWSWPQDRFDGRFTGTHDLPLSEALALGVELGCIPRCVTVWTIAGKCFQPGVDATEAVKAASDALADRLWKELHRA